MEIILPRVWSSLLKVKIEVDGMPVERVSAADLGLHDRLHRRAEGCGLRGIDRLGDFLFTVPEDEKLVSIGHVRLPNTWRCLRLGIRNSHVDRLHE